jgi:hypothetical protein
VIATPGPPTFLYEGNGFFSGSGGDTIINWGPIALASAESATRRVVGVFSNYDTNQIIPSGATINGVTATITPMANVHNTRDYVLYIVNAIVPTGATATFQANFTGGGQFGIATMLCYSVDNSTLISGTPTLVNGSVDSGTLPVTITIPSVPQGAAIIAAAGGFGTTDPASFTTPNDIGTFPENYNSNSRIIGMLNNRTAGVNQRVSFTFGGAGSFVVAGAAVFR